MHQQPAMQKFVQPALLIQLALFFADVFQIVHAGCKFCGSSTRSCWNIACERERSARG